MNQGIATQRDRERDTLIRNMGKRIRWVREAYEEREKLQHSQAQWAQALGVSKTMMSRIESGQIAPIDILFRIIYRSGASLDYLVWGVLDRGAMLDWLYKYLNAN